MKIYTFPIIIILLLICNNHTYSNSQIQATADSLISIINTEKVIDKKIDNYLALIKIYQKNNIEKSINFCDSALAICKAKNLKIKEIELKIEKARSLILSRNYEKTSELIFEIELDVSKNNRDELKGNLNLLKSSALLNISEFAQAMDNALKAIIFFKNENDSIGLAKAYNNIGLIYEITNNNHKALENYLISKYYAQAKKDNQLLADLDNNIGIIYDKLKDHEKALKYYFKALEYNNSIGDLNGSATSFNNIASLLTELGRYEEAMVYYKKALDISIITKNISNEAMLRYNLGCLYSSLNMLDTSEFYLNGSLKIYFKNMDAFNISETFNLLGNLYKKQKRYTMAIDALEQCVNYAATAGVLHLQETGLKTLSEIYGLQHDYKTAFAYQQKANTISDSLSELKKIEELKYSDFQIEFQIQSEKFEKDLRRNDELYRKELKKQKSEKYTYALFLLLIIMIALVLYRSSHKSSKINKKLVQKNREVEDQKELIEISNIELREQYAFTETLLNTIPNPVFYTDRNSHLLGCNKAFEEIMDKNLNDLVGIDVKSLKLNFDISCDATRFFDDSEKKLVRNEGVLTFADGTDHDVICFRKGIINAEDKLMGVLGILIDITDIRETENKLKDSQARLREVINAKDKFFNIMAHDLKNPFNAILGLTALIADDFENHTETELIQYIKLINQSSTQIYSLLENLLEWARAQSGSIEKNPTVFTINAIIQDCINLFNQSIQQKNIALTLDFKKDYEALADKNMILTVLRNLLSNALKFTDTNGSIRIKVEKKDDYLKISVIDSGVGIQPENLERLFKIDQPVSTRGIDNEKGTGLGLIICKEFVKQNGGTIIVTSEVGKGSTFSFTLPV